MNVHAKPLANDSYGEWMQGKLFVAAPMSGFDTVEAYQAHRDETLELVEHLENLPETASVYYAGRDIPSSGEFSGPNKALMLDLGGLIDSDAMIMLYPTKVVSGALIEVGIAIGKKIPVLIVVKDRADLPYMFREVDEFRFPNENLAPIRVICADSALDSLDEIQRFLRSQI